MLALLLLDTTSGGNHQSSFRIKRSQNKWQDIIHCPSRTFINNLMSLACFSPYPEHASVTVLTLWQLSSFTSLWLSWNKETVYFSSLFSQPVDQRPVHGRCSILTEQTTIHRWHILCRETCTWDLSDLAQQGDVQMQIIAVKADLLNKEVQIKQKSNFLKKDSTFFRYFLSLRIHIFSHFLGYCQRTIGCLIKTWIIFLAYTTSLMQNVKFQPQIVKQRSYRLFFKNLCEELFQILYFVSQWIWWIQILT